MSIILSHVASTNAQLHHENDKNQKLTMISAASSIDTIYVYTFQYTKIRFLYIFFYI